jgi:hypothetical protein
VPQATLRVQDTGDCSGLKTVTAGGGTEAITDGTYAKNVTLTVGIADEGRVSVPVTVIDNAGNPDNLADPTIIYDPSDTDATVSGDNQQGLPVIEAAGTLTVNDTADARRTILRTLSFSGVDVNDNLYNALNGVSVPEGGEFWGVWIATEYLGANGSATPVGPSSTTLSWTPVEVTSRTCSGGTCSFRAPVNLFTGLGFGPRTDKAGTYRVYVRFLDGAGNPSTVASVMSEDVVLASGYRLPGSVLGVISR